MGAWGVTKNLVFINNCDKTEKNPISVAYV